MTEASTGLRKALARAGDGGVVALSEMQAADIMAGLTDEQKVELAASLPAAAIAADPMVPKKKDGCSEDGDEDDKDGETDPGMKKKAEGSSEASGAAVADTRVKAVAAAVASDENCKGKADLALQMLADDDYASLSASGIVKLLGKQPIASGASDVDPEAAARADMKAAINSTTNSNIDATGGGKAGAKADAGSAAWDKAIAGMKG